MNDSLADPLLRPLAAFVRDSERRWMLDDVLLEVRSVADVVVTGFVRPAVSVAPPLERRLAARVLF